MKKIISKYNDFSKRRKMEKWCKLYLNNGYIINDDYTITSNKSVNLYGVDYIPYKFNTVYGSFLVNGSKITNFDNFPDECMLIDISGTNITSLDDLPRCQTLYISHTNITSIEGIICRVYAGSSKLLDVPDNNIPVVFTGTPIFHLLSIIDNDMFSQDNTDADGHTSTEFTKNLVYRLHEFDVLKDGVIDIYKLDSMYHYMGYKLENKIIDKIKNIKEYKFIG